MIVHRVVRLCDCVKHGKGFHTSQCGVNPLHCPNAQMSGGVGKSPCKTINFIVIASQLFLF